MTVLSHSLHEAVLERFQHGLAIRWPHSQSRFECPSPVEMAALDKKTIDSGVPEAELMERAGRAVLECAEPELERVRLRKGKVLIACGPGNNGGDGLVVARVLSARGWNVQVLVTASARYSKAFSEQLARLRKSTAQVLFYPVFPEGLSTDLAFPVADDARAREILSKSEIVVDALLGTGQKEAPRENIAKLISLINEAEERHGIEEGVLAVDIPSGVNGATGEAYAPHISARKTVTIELAKRGLLQYPGRAICGELVIAPIGIHADGASEFSALAPGELLIPKRAFDLHKGALRRIVIVGGSHSMPGAPILAGLAALKSGAGLVSVVMPDGCARSQAPSELIFQSVPGRDGTFSEASVDKLLALISEESIVLFGPGMGSGREVLEFSAKLLGVLSKRKVASVVDADGLNAMARLVHDKNWNEKLSHSVITPHPGEAGRLLGRSSAEVQKDRYAAARELSNRFEAVTIVKGASTIVYAGAKGVVNLFGNPYMATPGSGDVLAGIVASLLSQNIEACSAAKLAVLLHSLAGDSINQKHGGPMLASEMAEQLPGLVGAFTAER